MIFVGTKLNIVDNSGGKIAVCIRIFKNKKIAKIGDLVKVTLKEGNNITVKQGVVYKAIVVNSKYPISRIEGNLRYSKNSIVILNEKNELIGTRINASIPREIIKNLHNNSIIKKIISLTPELL
ncbi:uL14 family ribosomal protein [Candidatus Vidania fulgoroideorum]